VPVPMIDDLELTAVQRIRQQTRQDYAKHRIPGLEGELHQRLGRRSHRVLLSGVLLPASAEDDLKTLQEKAAGGEEITFTADITTALEIDRMVIESFQAEQTVGPAGQVAYSIVLSESPPLPPPAEVSAFGGLDGFGMGDLGFDAGALGDVMSAIEEQAGALGELADAAMAAVDQLQALASLADFGDLGNPVKPLADQVGSIGALAGQLAGLKDVAAKLAGGGS
jgi:phage protein U